MGSPIAWFDVAADDPKKSRKFYADLFDWEINVDEAMDYGMVDTGATEGISGGIGKAGDGTPPGIVVYAAVEDAKAALEKAESLGGKAVAQPYEIPGYGLMAVFEDPEGNRVGLWQR
jgi:uncharacterized protein